MPSSHKTCPSCGDALSSHFRRSDSGKTACPYEGLAYSGLRAGHDRIYFGAWRKMDAEPREIIRAYHSIGRHLRAIERALGEMDLPSARRDLAKAAESYHSGNPVEDSRDALRYMDHALSYAHRVIDDLLHELGIPSHAPMDFAEWYDVVEVPFRDEW